MKVNKRHFQTKLGEFMFIKPVFQEGKWYRLKCRSAGRNKSSRDHKYKKDTCMFFKDHWLLKPYNNDIAQHTAW